MSFGRVGPADPMDRLTSAYRDLIKRHGGQILYTFRFPAARVRIPTKNVRSLAVGAPSVSILYVLDPRRYDWPIAVGYRRPYSYVEGERRFRELGGRVEYRFDAINALGGLIPDRSVAALRGDPNVEYVEGVPPYPYCS